MEPLIELIRQIDDADPIILYEICDKIDDMLNKDGQLDFIHIDKLCVYTFIGVIYNNKIKNNYAWMSVIYGNKILKLIWDDKDDNINVTINYYSTTYDIINEIIYYRDFNLYDYRDHLVKHENVDTSWLFSTTPVKSARYFF